MFTIFKKSIFNLNEISEYKTYLNGNDFLNKYFLYEGYVLKGTNINNGIGIEYQINKDNILFEG